MYNQIYYNIIFVGVIHVVTSDLLISTIQMAVLTLEHRESDTLLEDTVASSASRNDIISEIYKVLPNVPQWRLNVLFPM